jgi:Protein of unknown function (DUF3551)
VISPRPLETPELGLVTQQDGHMYMFQAWHQVEEVISKAAFILAVFAAVVFMGKRVQAEQNYPWCINKPDTPPQCRYTTLEQCLADRLGKGGSCSPSPYPSSPEPRPATRLQRR